MASSRLTVHAVGTLVGTLVGTVAGVVAGVVILAGGALAEVASSTGPAAAVLDWAVGAAFVAAALQVSRSSARGTNGLPVELVLGLLTAALWFTATATGVLVLAHRGPLLHWLSWHSPRIRNRTSSRCLVLLGYVVALTGSTLSAAVTAGVAAALGVAAITTWGGASSARPDRRTALVAVLLGAVWIITVLGGLPSSIATPFSAGCLLAVAAWLSRPAEAGRLNSAIDSLILELGPSDRAASPVSASLAAALADPDLLVRIYQPDTGWRDEVGRPVPDPATSRAGTTELATPGGGRVVLVHGGHGSPDADLARAAAAAAALVLERVQVEAQVSREAEDVRRSGARLVTVDDAEREALASELRAGAIRRLERVGQALHQRQDPRIAPVASELDRVIGELERLAGGLNPASLSAGGLDAALRDLAASAGLPVTLTVTGDLAELREDVAALIWFVCSEALVNVVRHARARQADLKIQREPSVVRLEIQDDGCGGAVAAEGGGLQGLADRIALAHGTFALQSPPGGPTLLIASVPVS